MIFSLDVRRARKGDCMLLHYGTAQAPGLMLIDGGPSGVYGPHLKPRLEAIRAARGIADDKPLPVDLLMVSHVDDDHIKGILDMAKEMLEARDDNKPLIASVFSLWHNSFDQTIGNKPDELTAAITAEFPTAAASGELPVEATIESDDHWPGERPDEEVIVDTIKVLASVRQGFRLRLDADKLGWERNPEFDGELVIADGSSIDFEGGLVFDVVGPLLDEIKALQKKHDDWLEDLEEQGKSPEAALAAYVDKSVANLASIVVLAKADGRSMLLTGDARGDKVLDGLAHIEVLTDAEPTLHVDILKVPHHGSANNLETDFFERITAEHYVFSGDGKHGNPEREAFEMLFEARGDQPFTIHLTYPIDEIDVEREKDWDKERAKEIKRNEKRVAEGKPERPVRAEWSDNVNSLGALFESHDMDAAGQSILIVPEDAPHLIELHDALGH